MRKHKPMAYLSGGMEYATNEGAGWRKKMEHWLRESLGHTSFNPNHESEKFLRTKIGKADFRKMKSTNHQRYAKTVHGIVRLDSRTVATKADYLICLWDESAQRGAGTKGELTLARYFNKPVYLVSAMSFQDIPGWVIGCTTQMFQTFEELQRFLRKKFK